MDNRIAKLLAAFEKNGWEILGTVDKKEWWFTEIYELSSTWRPAGTILYLTMLNDIMIEDVQVVYCVGASSTVPLSYNDNFFEKITFADIHHNLTAVVQKINARLLKI